MDEDYPAHILLHRVNFSINLRNVLEVNEVSKNGFRIGDGQR